MNDRRRITCTLGEGYELSSKTNPRSDENERRMIRVTVLIRLMAFRTAVSRITADIIILEDPTAWYCAYVWRQGDYTVLGRFFRSGSASSVVEASLSTTFFE